MNILFVCKYNRFRSKVAEALFNKYNENHEIKAGSAGVNLDFVNPMVAESVQKAVVEKGAKIADIRSIPLTNYWFKWADKIIVVADNVDVKDFPREKVEVWPIKDANESDIEGIKSGVQQIERRIRELIIRLNL